jgi:hypothetical protein
MPWLVAKALASFAWKLGHYDLAAVILTGFCFFLRSMEFLPLPAQNVVVDPHTSQIVVTLEKTKTSKQFQQSLALRHRGLARLLTQALPRLLERGPIDFFGTLPWTILVFLYTASGVEAPRIFTLPPEITT